MCIVVVSIAHLWCGYEKTDFIGYTTANQLHFHGEQKASIEEEHMNDIYNSHAITYKTTNLK